MDIVDRACVALVSTPIETTCKNVSQTAVWPESSWHYCFHMSASSAKALTQASHTDQQRELSGYGLCIEQMNFALLAAALWHDWSEIIDFRPMQSVLRIYARLQGGPQPLPLQARRCLSYRHPSCDLGPGTCIRYENIWVTESLQGCRVRLIHLSLMRF
jgi:hypothetical protein